ncbi:3'(2'),5'-bisphosphate nucleotidase CysQ [Deferrisoma camini]|uniref:3'(2'),5'-bisphosphate nucleotidase CysQ n=1 Tax=Deferrisoma camini TaxID=1035120 RepID=UPI00046CB580|nr:3'(2'),5'-bisphosphate nucleotidase CysQ [Deferrisoma camini]
MDNPNPTIRLLLELAEAAAAEILRIYEGDIQVEEKGDRSPLTEADRAAHRVIAEGLARAFPDVPVLSEEGREIPYATRRAWSRFWLVDPLDGTKEFIKRNGEFTVNIALVEGGRPVLGVIHVPVQGRVYWGDVASGAWTRQAGGEPRPIRVRRPDPARGLVVVQSRSHPSPETEAYLKGLPVAESIAAGSSLKLCAVAEGRADLYPRLGPTMEWDTAAGQAIVEAAGGRVETLDGEPLRYNKPDLRNPYFVAKGAGAVNGKLP